MSEKFPNFEWTNKDPDAKKVEVGKFTEKGIEVTGQLNVPESNKTDVGQEKKGEMVTLNSEQLTDHLVGKPELQEKIFGKVLSEEEIKNLRRGMSAKVMFEVMESMNLRPLTIEELLELRGASAEEKEAAKEWMKKMSVIPSVGDEFEKQKDSAPEAERVRDFSVVDFFEKVKAVLAKESPTPEELEDAKSKFAAIEEIRNGYIEAVWGFKGPEEEEKALSGKLSLGKGGKDEITLIAPSEFFEVKAKLESK